ncbi:MAG TPA: hypothetical protein PLL50_10770 [Propionicimonas sp.]|nr:hypothetical protein [Propionicimonas sp.]HQA78824.1 hypothetical protein [Propionicimonas sp.]HQD96649.1 hypothetical protein [Propionicimonas sp.]
MAVFGFTLLGLLVASMVFFAVMLNMAPVLRPRNGSSKDLDVARRVSVVFALAGIPYVALPGGLPTDGWLRNLSYIAVPVIVAMVVRWRLDARGDDHQPGPD